MPPFIYLMFCCCRPLCGEEEKSKIHHCPSGAAQWYKQEGWEREYCMRLACQIQQSDSQGHLCTLMSLMGWQTGMNDLLSDIPMGTRERERTILTLCPFSLISGKEWLRGVRDLSEPSWITQARLYDGNSPQKQWMQLIGSSFRPLKSLISFKE